MVRIALVRAQRGTMQRPVRTLTFQCPTCGSLQGIPLEDNERPERIDEVECSNCHTRHEVENDLLPEVPRYTLGKEEE